MAQSRGRAHDRSFGPISRSTGDDIHEPGFPLYGSGDALYAIGMASPENGHARIQALAQSKDQNLPEFHGIIQTVTILGHEEQPIDWQVTDEGLQLTLNQLKPTNQSSIKLQ